MKELFKEVVRINMLADTLDAKAGAENLFASLHKLETPEYFNWAKEIFEEIHVKNAPDKPALIWSDIDKGEKTTLTYSSLLFSANQLINYFLNTGVAKGDSVYTVTPVLAESWITTLAAVKAGMVSIPVAVDMPKRALKFRFETYPPDVIIADEASVENIDNALEELGIKPKIKLVIGETQGWTSFNVIEKEKTEAESARTKSDDILFCFFTSGTTGLPKRVGHTALSFPVGHLSTTLMLGVGSDDVCHSLCETGWARWVWSNFFVPFNVGATGTGFKSAILDGEQYLDAVSENKVTSFCAPPMAWRMFAKMNLDSFNLSNIRHCVSIGEPLSPDSLAKWQASTRVPIREFYCQTEASAMIGNPPWMKDKVKPGSFGRPLGMYDMTLADNFGDEITEPDETGHIVIKIDKRRSIGLFSEYIGNPEKMSSVFVDNFYYTGDRGCFDKDGYWYFQGRADDVIKSSDHRVGPFEVESALLEHTAVSETAVIGAPDSKHYQLVKAFVILKASSKSSKEMALELFKHATGILPKSKVPRVIEFVTDLPKTMSGKIRRVELRHMDHNSQDSSGETIKEYFYWDFAQLGSKKKI